MLTLIVLSKIQESYQVNTILKNSENVDIDYIEVNDNSHESNRMKAIAQYSQYLKQQEYQVNTFNIGFTLENGCDYFDEFR